MDTELVIFDLDGTLVDSVEDLTLSLNHGLAAAGLPSVTIGQVREYVGDGARNLVARALRRSDSEGAEGGVVADQVYEVFIAHYGEHLLDHTKLYPGVAQTLLRLRKRSRLSVLSNKGEALSRRILEGLGVAGNFVGIFGGDSFPAKKPDPGGFRAIMSQLGAQPAATLVVGDSGNDIIGGKAAGARTCGVLYGLKPEEVVRSGPDYTVGEISEILDFVTPCASCSS